MCKIGGDVSHLGLELMLKAKFHYAIWSQTGPKLVCSEQKFGLSSIARAAGLRPTSFEPVYDQIA